MMRANLLIDSCASGYVQWISGLLGRRTVDTSSFLIIRNIQSSEKTEFEPTERKSNAST